MKLSNSKCSSRMFLFDIKRTCRREKGERTKQSCSIAVPADRQNMTEGCWNELGLRQSTPQECVVSAAKAHAASIRRTLWLKEQKRVNGRVHIANTPTSRQGGENTRKLRSRDDNPPIIDGHIYSPDYWRAWQIRSKARARSVSDWTTQRCYCCTHNT